MKKILLTILSIIIVCGLMFGAYYLGKKHSAPSQPSEETAAAPTPIPFSLIAYRHTINQLELHTSSAHAALAPLIEFEGILPDEAVHTFLNFLNDVIEHSNQALWDENPEERPPSSNAYIYLFEGYGGPYFRENFRAIHHALSGRLSETYERYLSNIATLPPWYIAVDAALTLSWDDLSDYIVEWYSFRAEHPDFVEIDRITPFIHIGLIFYVSGVDNTPAWNWWNDDLPIDHLRDDVRLSYERFLANPANRTIGFFNDIQILYNAWQANDFIHSPEIQNIIERIAARYPFRGW